MNKIIRIIQRISLFVLLIVPILAILDLVFERIGLIRDIFPFPTYLKVSHTLLVTIECGSITIFPALLVLGLLALKSSRLSLRNTILLFSGTIFGVLTCCIFSVPALTLPEEITSSVQLNHHHYYATVLGQFGDQWVNYYLYKCNEKDLECDNIYQYASMGDPGAFPILFVDDNMQDIHFFFKTSYGSSTLIYTYGPSLREYKWRDYEPFGSAAFNLYTYETKEIYQFVITKEILKDQKNAGWEFLPFHYSSLAFGKADLVKDEGAQEIKLLIDDQTILTYNTALHCQVEGCVIFNR
jgi:hypothetical protein